MGVTVLILFAASIISFAVVKRFETRGLLFGAVVMVVAAGLMVKTLVDVQKQGFVVESGLWIPQIDFNIDFYADNLRISFAFLTLIAGALILFYSRWYFNPKDSGLARFSALFVGFAAAMFGLVLADNLYLFFVFWEATTVLSFLLIGHQNKIRASRSAAMQALIVTTFGGLSMLVGMVLMHISTQTVLISEIFNENFEVSAISTVSVFLILVGALTKSAIFPFHFWLPDAMAAPTPVSAYLHAAAMVKAGVLLALYLNPIAASIPGYTPVLVVLGAVTMLWGGYRSLKQYDLKLLVAHSTVSQLGMLIMLLGITNEATKQAAILLIFAHAIVKAPLFLIVGIIDHRFGTRDMRELSHTAKKYPVLAVVAALAAASLAGVVPLLGFVSKEAALTALFDLATLNPVNLLALVAFILGSVLTAAYMFRFLFGSFGTKKSVPPSEIKRKEVPMIIVSPAIFVGLALSLGLFSKTLDTWLVSASSESSLFVPLGLWHGLTPTLAATVLIIGFGSLIGFFSLKRSDKNPSVPERLSFSHGYWRLTHLLDLFSVRVTAVAQRGSLPWYLAVILITLGLSQIFIRHESVGLEYTFMQNFMEIPIAIVMIVAAIRAAQSTTRFKSVVLVGVTGYSMVALFVMLGAPDLALTQALVETVTLITFILVIRRLPIKIFTRRGLVNKGVRIVLSLGAAFLIGALALVSFSSRTEEKISTIFGELAEKYGHGLNIVNVTLVDMRAWDTMGELSVIVVAATGVASLIFVISRGDNLPKLSRREARQRVQKHLLKVVDPNDETRKGEWILSGVNLDPKRRSIILEVVVRLLFHALMMLSVYLLLAGHNAPGGGFAGGLVAGLALTARYLAGGRHELGATINVDAGKVLGVGLLLATVTALVPLFFGFEALRSTWFDISLGPLGDLTFVTSSVFDVGVYLVVFGLVLDVLRSLGAQIDEDEEADASERQEVSSR